LDAVARSTGIHSIRDAFPRANPGNLGRLQMETLEAALLKTKEFPHVNE
jgi:hypothetical protein